MSINTNIILNALPAFIILAIAESIALSLEHKNTETKKNVLASLGIGLIFIFCSFFSKGFLLFVYSFLYEFRVIHIEHFTWWIWATMFYRRRFFLLLVPSGLSLHQVFMGHTPGASFFGNL